LVSGLLKGFFEDGIWLETPISFSKLFTQSKSYSEEKLQAFATLFINMLNFDGITVVDTTGRLLAYNVFVENNINRTKNVVGGARKRAAYTIINSRRKHIVGVYFQSHEGEIFYKSLVKPKEKKETTKSDSVDTKVDSTKEATSQQKEKTTKEKSEVQKLEVESTVSITEPIKQIEDINSSIESVSQVENTNQN